MPSRGNGPTRGSFLAVLRPSSHVLFSIDRPIPWWQCAQVRIQPIVDKQLLVLQIALCYDHHTLYQCAVIWATEVSPAVQQCKEILSASRL